MNSLPQGPIGRLPNELLQMVLSKLEFHELFPIRRVSKLWKSSIETIGGTKKSLIFSLDNCKQEYLLRQEKETAIRFFGKIKMRDFVRIKLAREALYPINAKKLGAFLLAHFPRVEYLVLNADFLFELKFLLNLWPANQISTLSLDGGFDWYNLKHNAAQFAECVNAISSLKRLDLKGDFNYIVDLLSPILVNLEHFSYDRTNCRVSTGADVKFVHHLGPKCTHFWFHFFETNWITLQRYFDSNFVSGLTHVNLHVGDEDFNTLANVCDNFPSLQSLQISPSFSPKIKFTPQLVNALSRAPNLSELQFYNFHADFGQWEKPDIHFTPLTSLRTCTLHIASVFDLEDYREQLTVVLLTALPKIRRLTIRINQPQRKRVAGPGLILNETDWAAEILHM